MNAREEILTRIRTALRDIPPTETPSDVPIPRHYLDAHVPDNPHALAELLAENLTDYRATVHHSATHQLPDTIAQLLTRHGSTTLAIPTDLPPTWLTALHQIRVIPDHPPLSPHDLDHIDTVLTGCALAIAETGTLILDTGPTQGRRALTLIPDHHIAIVHAPDQIVASLPHALPRLNPTRPQTWISGPSATSDIELNRVEGVHGPRHLDVIIVTED
ncbi:MAG TPA: lactate utilization protein C [Actinocrinis sp.]|nr:lactate utilization protein C [Actinocrinis sp.]